MQISNLKNEIESKSKREKLTGVDISQRPWYRDAPRSIYRKNPSNRNIRRSCTNPKKHEKKRGKLSKTGSISFQQRNKTIQLPGKCDGREEGEGDGGNDDDVEEEEEEVLL